jgi:hypothetical protein
MRLRCSLPVETHDFMLYLDNFFYLRASRTGPEGCFYWYDWYDPQEFEGHSPVNA